MTQVQKKIFLTLVLGCLSATALPQDGYGLGGDSGGGGGGAPAPTPGGGGGTTPAPVAGDFSSPEKYEAALLKGRTQDWTTKYQQLKGQAEITWKGGDGSCKRGRGTTLASGGDMVKYGHCLIIKKKFANQHFAKNFLEGIANNKATRKNCALLAMIHSAHMPGTFYQRGQTRAKEALFQQAARTCLESRVFDDLMASNYSFVD